jgi:hypothetical protein
LTSCTLQPETIVEPVGHALAPNEEHVQVASVLSRQHNGAGTGGQVGLPPPIAVEQKHCPSATMQDPPPSASAEQVARVPAPPHWMPGSEEQLQLPAETPAQQTAHVVGAVHVVCPDPSTLAAHSQLPPELPHSGDSVEHLQELNSLG